MSDKYLHQHEHQEPQQIRDKRPEKDFIRRYQDDLRARLGRAMQSEAAVLEQILPTLSQQFLEAVERGNPETVKIFLDAGIDINYRHPRSGQTACTLLLLRRRGRPCASFLVRGNAIS